MKPEMQLVAGFFALMMVLVVFAVVFIVHDRSVTCHYRIHKSDECWKDLNEQVRDLRARVRELEQR